MARHITADGHTHVTLQYSEEFAEGRVKEVLLDVVELAPPPQKLRLDRIVYALSDGLAVSLYWAREEHGFILTLEGRGVLDFEKVGGVADEEASTSGLAFTTTGIGSLFLLIDMTKQGV